MNIIKGTTFTDPGYTASFRDADYTSSVTVTGSIDTATVGTYTKTYSLAVAGAEPVSVIRRVNVINPPPPDGSTVVYLTFDDGPWPGTTTAVLDMLAQEQVKATFFVTGSRVNAETQADLRREKADGHAIGLHTWSHIYSQVYSSDQAYWDDLTKIHDYVQHVTGINSSIVRLPGGSSNTVSKQYSPGIMTRITNELAGKGYHYFDWNVSSGDGGNVTDVPSLVRNMESETRQGHTNIVLNHDTHPATAEAVRQYIDWCKTKGYAFATIDMSTPQIHQKVVN